MTPMLQQYLEIKEKYKDAILFYRIGDFYEMFFDDAMTASKVLDIVLTSRNKNDPNPVPLCGVPYHSVQPYLKKLIDKGYKVAICDQVEDPKLAKGVVKREVTRVVTPGLSGTLDGKREERESHYLASLCKGQERWGIAFLEISTGDFRVMDIPPNQGILKEELERIGPREILLSERFKNEEIGWKADFCLSYLPEWVWDETYARRILYEQFRVSTLSGFNCEEIPTGIVAAGAVLHYARETQRVDRLPHLTSLKREERGKVMILGKESQENLSLDDLISLIDQTKTAMGSRRLKEWFYQPLIQKGAIEARYEAIGEFLQHLPLLESIRKKLENVYDLERVSGRLSLGTANARDLKGLEESLAALDQIQPILLELQSSLLREISSGWNSFSGLRDAIGKVLVEAPPLALKEGGLIQDRFHPELDELRRLRHDAKGSIAAIEERERGRTGIGSLKVHYNKVFGYYLEVPSTRTSKVPPDFIRKQTLANAERYITPELKEFEIGRAHV